MSRVEPKHRPAAPHQEKESRHPQTARVGRTPGKAEGDERTVEEALRRQEKK